MSEPSFEILPVRARRQHVLLWLGVSRRTFRKLVSAGVIVPHQILGAGYPVYWREELLAAARDGRIEAAPMKRPTEEAQRREGAKARRRAA
jgi:hypothetical protein